MHTKWLEAQTMAATYLQNLRFLHIRCTAYAQLTSMVAACTRSWGSPLEQASAFFVITKLLIPLFSSVCYDASGCWTVIAL